MKKSITIAGSIALAVTMSAAVLFAGCGPAAEPKAPDYSQYTDKFDSYAYAAVSDGTHLEDGVSIDSGKDYRDEQHYKDYLDCGLNILLPQDCAQINGSPTEANVNNAKAVFDGAYAAGITKIIMQDTRIQALSVQNTIGLVGDEGQPYATEEALDAKVEELLSLYWDWNGFYGVMFRDEPAYDKAQCFGDLYKSIKRVGAAHGKDIYVQYNLNPMSRHCVMKDYYPVVGNYNSSSSTNPNLRDTDISNEELAARYEAYLDCFINAMDVDYVQFDIYPMLPGSIDAGYIPCLQLAARVCKKHDIELRIVAQTFDMRVNGALKKRHITEKEARWLNNTMLAMGVKQISYFTYFTKKANSTASGGEFFIDGASFVKWNGEKTEIYDFMKSVIADNNSFANIYKQFKYVGSKTYKAELPTYNTEHIEYAADESNGGFQLLKDFTINKECALVSELYDAANRHYMYTYTNLVDPGEGKGAKAYETAEMTFNAGYTRALVIAHRTPTTDKPESFTKSIVKLDNGKLTLKAAAGDAYYVIPY